MSFQAKRIPFLAFALALAACASAKNTHIGDRAPDIRVVYPESAFFHNGGRVIDVTQPPFNASGDGKTDDTKAIISAYDFVALQSKIANDRIKRLGTYRGKRTPIADSYVIYFPEGEYLISDTLIYSFEAFPWKTNPDGMQLGALNKLRFIGENRENTIIRLRDNAPGFDGKEGKPVLTLGKILFNNVETSNVLAHLTIDTGKGNPGAIGYFHYGANVTHIEDVTIRSGDGQGVAGMAIYSSPTMGYHNDITIEGFQYGIHMTPYHMTHNSFEYLTLRDQNVVAISLQDATTSLRAVLVENANGPALELLGDGSQAAIADSALNGSKKNKAKAAITAQKGSILAMDVTTRGYKRSLLTPSEKRSAPTIDRATYPAPIGYPRTTKFSDYQRIEIADTPTPDLPTSGEDWAEVDHYIETLGLSPNEDVSSAVQAALDSGKAHILFGKQQYYYLQSPVTVPAHVVRINGLFTNIKGKKNVVFRIAEASQKPLIVENLDSYDTGPLINQEASRDVIISTVVCPSGLYKNANSENRTRLFLNNVAGAGKPEGIWKNQDVWARWIDTEYPLGTNFDMENSNAWIFGYKTEKHQVSFSAREGSHLEVFGGVSNQFIQKQYLIDGYSPHPTYLVEDSQAAVFACTNGPSTSEAFGFKTLLTAKRDGEETNYEKDDAPARPGRLGQHIIPLSIVIPE